MSFGRVDGVFRFVQTIFRTRLNTVICYRTLWRKRGRRSSFPISIPTSINWSSEKNPNLGGEQVIKNSLELLIIYLLHRANNRDAQQEFFISKINSSTELQDEIVRILSSKLYDTFVLDDLCNALHYGKTYLCTFFREKTGMSIYQTYLN